MQSSTVSPFNWRAYTAREEKAGTPKATARPLSARARAERILAQRWGNPYCKPGLPRS